MLLFLTHGNNGPHSQMEGLQHGLHGGSYISVETFCRVHDGGYDHAGKRKQTFTNLIKGMIIFF